MINLVLVMIRIGKVMILPCIFAGILVTNKVNKC